MKEINLYLVIFLMVLLVMHVFTLSVVRMRGLKISGLKKRLRNNAININEIVEKLFYEQQNDKLQGKLIKTLKRELENKEEEIDNLIDASNKMVEKIEELQLSKGTLGTLEDKVQEWFITRNLHKGDPQKQVLKLIEEMGELVGSLIRDDREEIIDALGDIQVVMIGLGMQLDLDLKDCLMSAYSEIVNRRGETVNGIFVKEEDLK